MLYPSNIIIKKKQKIQVIKEKIIDAKKEIIKKLKYILFDRKHFCKRLFIKLHL